MSKWDSFLESNGESTYENQLMEHKLTERRGRHVVILIKIEKVYSKHIQWWFHSILSLSDTTTNLFV